MLMKKISVSMLLPVLVLLFLAQAPEVKAWGPITHVYYTNDVLKHVTGTYLTSIIESNKEWFLCGMMYPDVTVLYYYTEWTAYSATHAWEFQRRLWNDAVNKHSEQAKAFAIGVGTHLLQDSVTHNYWIPEKIRGTFVQNNIIHPLSEGLLEAELAGADPLAEAIASTSFTYWNKPFSDSDAFYDPSKGRNLTPVEWTDSILGASFQDEASLFNTILYGGEFYTKGYAIPETGGLWGLYKGFSNLVKNFVSTEDAEPYINMTIQITIDWYRNGLGPDPSNFVAQTDPTGYGSLMSADAFVANVTIAIVVAICLVIFYYYYRRRKG